ncbi:MAG: NADH-quinone oxidoreductase subunit M [Desulfurivibrionaceae bacterium]|nr:NADH-quinone oxidoreductase subunit M [Desulfurivibrionaceae bacterium]
MELIISGGHLLSWLIFIPLIGAGLLFFTPGEENQRRLAFVVTSVNALLSLKLWSGFDASTAALQFGERFAWIPSLNIEYALGLDGISILLVMLTTFIMPLCVLGSWTYISKRVKEFMVCLLVMETAMIGVFCAMDFVLFYVFWEMMLIPMYLLIGVWGGARRKYASVKFFLYTLAGSVLLLVAIIALYLANDHSWFIPDMMGKGYSMGFQVWIFLAFFLAFAIKVPMFPFHTWLPAAHVEAPGAGSVILASVLLKMGTYGFLRFGLPITPQATLALAPYMLWLSIAGILYGGFTALAQSDMKKLIAYSSVGHMGFVTLGIFVLNTSGVEGALIQMVNHGITTGALFLMIGMIYERTHSREIKDHSGLAYTLPIFVSFLTIFALSSLGFPGTNSFIGEFLILVGAFSHNKIIAGFAIPGAVLAAAYMLRLLQHVLFKGKGRTDISDLNFRECLTLAPLLILVFWIGLAPEPFMHVMHTSVEFLLNQVHASQAVAALAGQ